MIGWTLGVVGLFWALDGLSESYVRLGLVTEERAAGDDLRGLVPRPLHLAAPATIVVLPLLFPDGPLPARRVGRRELGLHWACWSLGALAYTVVAVDQPTRLLPPGVDPDPTTISAIAPSPTASSATLQAADRRRLVVPVASSSPLPARPPASRATGCAGCSGASSSSRCSSSRDARCSTSARSPMSVLLRLASTLAPVAMTVAVVNPPLVSIEDLLGRTLVLGACSPSSWSRSTSPSSPASRCCSTTRSTSARWCWSCCWCRSLLYGPLRQRLVARRAAAACSATATTRTTSSPAWPRPWRAPTRAAEQLAAVARAVASAFGVRFVSVEVDRSGGERLVATYGERPAETRTLPITYRGAEVGRLVLPARGLRSRLSPPRRAAARRPRPPGRDRGPHQPARRGAAGQPRAAGRRPRGGAPPDPARPARRARPGAERRRLPARVRAAAGRPRPGGRARAARRRPARTCRTSSPTYAGSCTTCGRRRSTTAASSARCASRRSGSSAAATPSPADDLGALPAAVEVAAYRIAGEALTNVARHAAAARCTVRLDGVDGDELLVEVADDGRRHRRRRRRPASAWSSLRERAAELGGRSEVTCPPTGGTVVRAWLPAEEHRMSAAMTDIRVVVVDDHQIVRDGLVALLGALDGIEVVGIGRRRPRGASTSSPRSTPDVVVMDIQMPRARRDRGDPASSPAGTPASGS